MNRRPIVYSSDELAFIESHQKMKRRELHAEFVREFARSDVDIADIRNLCSRRGWTTDRSWSPGDDGVLRERYPDMPTQRLATLLGRTLSSVYGRASVLGLCKSEAFRASPDACRLRRGDNVGAEFRFKKGQAPPNKGVKHPKGWAPGRMRETQFAPGQIGHNWKPIGSTRLVDGYSYTKVTDDRNVSWSRNWKATHVIRWEAENGPIPEGHCLKSRDGNRLNVDPANWQLIARSMLLRLSGGRLGRIGYDEAPEELKPTIMAVAKLENAVRIRKRTRQQTTHMQEA